MTNNSQTSKRPRIQDAIKRIDAEILSQIESIEGVVEDFEFLQRHRENFKQNAELCGYKGIFK